MLNDFRYALRALRHKPGFSLTAVLSIALGIGANAAIFSFADGLLLRPLPVRNPSEIATLRAKTPTGTFTGVSWKDYTDYRDRENAFDGLMAYEPAGLSFAADAHAQPQLKGALLVSGNFFSVLGTEPRLGRGFRPEENEAPGRDAVVVLGHDFWNIELGADPVVIGRHVRLNGIDFTVIGVAPETFTGVDQYSRPALFVPAMMGPALAAANRDLLTDRSRRMFTVKGRLKPGVSIQSADSEAAALARSLEQTNPATNLGFGAAVRSEIQTRLDLAPSIQPVLGLLFGLVFVVLAIACANVANLMLSRGRSRSREMAVRLAIGASRFRLMRQLMAESLLIALSGGALGLLIARFFVVFAASSVRMPGEIPVQLNFQLDERVLWFTVVVSLLSAILFGLAPALQSTKTDLVPALKTGEADQARRRLLGRSALVVLQVAGSVVLLVVASQMSRGFSRELARDPGFRRDHVLMMSFDPSLARYTPAQTEQFYRVLEDRARTAPGVESAALASTAPMSINNQRNEMVIPEGYQFPRGVDHVSVAASTVDPSYFDTLRVPLMRGRGFDSSDTAKSRPVGIVNEAFARHYMGGDPIGRRFRLSQAGEWVEIVGMTATGRYFTTMEPPTEFLYLPLSQHPATALTMIVHSSGDPSTLAGPLRDMVRSIDPNLPVFGVRTMSDFVEQRSVKVLEFVEGTVASMGLLGLVLALVGLYAVVAYQVAGRTREIGIRMAIGADRMRVMRMILRQAAAMSLTGVAIGVGLSFAAGQVLKESPLIRGFDPLLFGAVPMALLMTTLLAAAIPARRAARVDPMVALRQD